MNVKPTDISMDARAFREVMGSFATGVAVVTTECDGERMGMTVNSLTSVSLEPTLLLVCFKRGSLCADAVRTRGLFAINLLSQDQESMCRQFVAKIRDRFVGLPVAELRQGIPILSDTLGHILCEVDATHAAGDHDIVIGRAIEARANPKQPLLFFRGAFWQLPQTKALMAQKTSAA